MGRGDYHGGSSIINKGGWSSYDPADKKHSTTKGISAANGKNELRFLGPKVRGKPRLLASSIIRIEKKR